MLCKKPVVIPASKVETTREKKVTDPNPNTVLANSYIKYTPEHYVYAHRHARAGHSTCWRVF
jgi:hypothetical protein